MKVSGRATKIQGKITVEYAGKGRRNQEVRQGRLAFEAGNLALQLLTKDLPFRVEIIKASCVGIYERSLGKDVKFFGDFIDFMVVWTGVIGKCKVTFQWVRPQEGLSEFILTGIEHSFGSPSLMESKIDVRAKSFQEKTEQVAKGLVKLVAVAIGCLKEPLSRKTGQVLKAVQEVESLIETEKKEKTIV